ncbi:hypothetical protein CVT24_005389 [Panaeolus cyanescens]|uniref:Mitochondrial carrier n=1 Tax=Panaeolus cyanescens TaxID=181874 RepID=A0A409VQZ1_9AGAR|nr:hypothetical protein CVT24_005389 [Panaeolus cyanescens]
MLKIKLQVETKTPSSGIGRHMYNCLKDIKQTNGWKGLYRGLMPNIAGNASSWGLYFLFYNMLKKSASGGDITKQLSAGEYLLCSAQASAVTAVMTNPLWLVRVRMFTTQAGSPHAYRGLWGMIFIRYSSSPSNAPSIQPRVYPPFAIRFLAIPCTTKPLGTSLALVGVSNGAIQFVVYEKMKAWGFDRRRKQAERRGEKYDAQTDKLTNLSYTFMSIGSKLAALAVTYPYQVVRSRIQNDAQAHLFPTIPATIKRTWQTEGPRGFFRGLAANCVRVLPGTCITFVVYENLAWLLRTSAAKRQRELEGEA